MIVRTIPSSCLLAQHRTSGRQYKDCYSIALPAKYKLLKGTGSKLELSVSEVFSTQCLLSWKPPTDDGGTPLTHYVIERQEQIAGSEWEEIGETAAAITTAPLLLLPQTAAAAATTTTEPHHSCCCCCCCHY